MKTWNPTTSAPVDFDYIDLSSIDQRRKVVTTPSRMKSPEAPSRARQLVESGDVLVSTVRPNLNGVAVVPPELHGATASTGFTVLRAAESLDVRYLFQWVQSPQFVEAMVRQATGASYPAVSDRIIKASEIPLPPLPEQRRIAAILDHADALRAKRRHSLTLLDTLDAALYSASFDDRTGSQVRPLGDLAEVVSGLTKGRRLSGQETRLVPYLAVANVQRGRLELASVKEIEATEAEIERYQLRPGDVVMTEGGDPDKLGRGTVWRGELPLCLHQNHIFRVRPVAGSGIDPTYLESYIASREVRAYFLSSAKQTTGIASINMTQLKALPVRVPASDRQRLFLDQLDSRQALRAAAQRSLDSLDELFASLQSRAFSGQL